MIDDLDDLDEAKLESTLQNTVIHWNPNGSITTRPWHKDTAYRYLYCWGACNAHVAQLDFEGRQNELAIKFVHMIVRDGMEPSAVHVALRQLEEYRAFFADVPDVLWGIPADKPTTAKAEAQ